MLFFYLFPMQELVTAIILLYIVPVSCGILYHFMFCSHVLLPLSNINLNYTPSYKLLPSQDLVARI